MYTYVQKPNSHYRIIALLKTHKLHYYGILEEKKIKMC